MYKIQAKSPLAYRLVGSKKQSICQSTKNSENQKTRVDRLFFNSLSGIEKYTKLWNVVQLLLLLSHGQASVEREFSVNKEIATSNLMEHNLIARRVIKDHVQSVGVLKQLLISKELLQSVQNARHQYHAHFESQKAQKEVEKKSVKRKFVEENIGNLRKKMMLIESDINLLLADADKASELKSVPHITKANAVHRKAKDKEDELKVVRKELSDTKHLLTDM